MPIRQRYIHIYPLVYLADIIKYMLEVIGAGNPEYRGQDWGDVWANSQNCKQLSDEISHTIESRRSNEKERNKDDDREYAMPIWTQVVAVTKRSFVAYWRTPEYNIVSPIPHASMILQTKNLIGQIRPAHLHRPLQHLYLLAPGQQLHRHAIPPLLRLHDPHHLSAAHPAAAASLSTLPGPLRVPRSKLEDLPLDCIRNLCYPA